MSRTSRSAETEPTRLGRMLDSLFILTIGIILGGCTSADKPQATPEQLRNQSLAAARECDLAYPPADRKVAVARAKCHTAAWEIMRPTMVDPDILDGLIARRIAIAQQVERGELTVSQGNEAIAKARSEAAAEEQRRTASTPARGSAQSVSSTPQ